MSINHERLRLQAKLFNGFADLSRLKLLYLLRSKSKSVTQLVNESKLSQPNVSSHLRCLKDCNLVISTRNGREVFYELGNSDIAGLLNLAEKILDVTYSELAACINYEVEG